MEGLSTSRLQPFSMEAELAVLGSLLVDPVKIGTVQSLLSAEDFYQPNHQLIFIAMDRVFNKQGTIDPIILAEQLAALDNLEKIGGQTFLLDLMDRTPSAENVEYYANIVKEKSTLRQLIQAAIEISEEAYAEADTVDNIVDRSEKRMLKIGEGSQVNAPQKISTLVAEAYERIIQLSEEKRDITGLPTGYHDLDKMTSGLQGAQLIIIAARPSVGKTAFALNIAQNVATKSHVPVAIFSLEMGALDLVFRMLCAEGNILASNMKTGNLSPEEWASFTVAIDTFNHSQIFIDDSAGIKVSEIRAKCRRLKQENPDLGLIVIDYLQLIEGNGRENRQQEVSEISRQLKKLAKELHVPVIALSQLSRGLEQRQNKRPILSDIRESGSIEQDADIVAFLYRHDYHRHDEGDGDPEHDDALPDNTVEVILAKNRSGARDTVNLLFKKEYNKFSNMSYRPEGM